MYIHTRDKYVEFNFLRVILLEVIGDGLRRGKQDMAGGKEWNEWDGAYNKIRCFIEHDEMWSNRIYCNNIKPQLH